ncbi:hypothetical protein FOMG_19787 [Fusarium oxysporum f. sp. melonis 26406]|uniref:C2H2-type domain-containing protein n=1 Tax=Fusarium oxysporum f. sp. melonis 26406 TaxID=1089452 RepID=W9Z590_FUSOX|nr:hypothetical protein FOMG_19787 [Fusarium oxysporum f. sp. melonis 26406]
MELVEQQYVARPFQCDWRSCTKGFNSKTDLQRHYRIHTNERPYACSISECGKRFIQKSALTVHIRTHTGEKPHQCQHLGCGWRFSDVHIEYYLQAHRTLIKFQSLQVSPGIEVFIQARDTSVPIMVALKVSLEKLRWLSTNADRTRKK